MATPKQQQVIDSYKKSTGADLAKTSTQATNGLISKPVSPVNTPVAPVAPANQSVTSMPVQTTAPLPESTKGLQPASQTNQTTQPTAPVDNTFQELDRAFATDGGATKIVNNNPSSTDSLTDLRAGEAQAAANLDSAQNQSNLLSDVNTVNAFNKDKSYRESQNKISTQADALNNENANIVSSKTLSDSAKQLNDLRQNIGFLGTGGRPGKSAAAMNAVADQITRGESLYQQIVQMEENKAQIQKLGVQYNAAAFEKTMSDLQDKLNTQVTLAKQNLIQGFQSESGQIDTLEEMKQLENKRKEIADQDITKLTNGNLQERQREMARFEKAIADKKEEIKLGNTVNKELSATQGFYVDGNGDPIISAKTGQPIMLPEEPPMDPIFDKESGQLITFSLDANGQIIGTPQQVIQEQTFAQETYTNLARAVANGTMTADQALEMVPKSGREAFIAQLATVKKYQEPKAQNDWKYNDKTKLYERTGPNGNLETTSVPQQTSSIDPSKMSSALDSAYNKCLTAPKQCGQFVNDYLQDLGVGRVFNTDTYEGKKERMNSSTPQVGSIAVMASPDSPKAGHVAIVTAVNTDGTITVSETNRDNKLAYGERTIPASSVDGYYTPQSANQSGSDMDRLNYENYVMNFVPQQDRGSDKEKERISAYVKEAMAAGLTPQQAGLAYRGFEIKDPANANTAEQYLNTLNNLPKFPDGGARILSDLINKGDMKGAKQYVDSKVEDAVISRYGKDAIPSSSMQTQEKMINSLRSLISKNPGKIGAFDGRVNDLVKKYKDEPEMQELQTLLSMIQANTRKTFAGSSVTPSEMAALQEYVGGTSKMTPNNLLTMLNTVYQNTKNEYDSQRSGYVSQGVADTATPPPPNKLANPAAVQGGSVDDPLGLRG